MAKVGNYKDDAKSIGKESASYLYISGTYCKRSSDSGYNRYIKITDLSCDDIDMYRGDNGFYDGNALVSDWRINHNAKRDFYRFLGNRDIKKITVLLSSLLGQDVIVEDNEKSYGNKVGRPRGIAWMHPFIFYRLAETLDILLGLRVMSLIITDGDMELISGGMRLIDIGDDYFKPKSMTYIAFDSLSGKFKIGKSNNIIRRESGLRAANPNVYMIAFCDDDVESELHGLYSDKRFFREWFNLSVKDVNGIISKYGFKRYGAKDLPAGIKCPRK